MKKLKNLFLVITMILCVIHLPPSYGEGKKDKEKSNKNKIEKERTFKISGDKKFNMIEKDASVIEKKNPIVEVTSSGEELIPVNVKNDFNEEIKVKLDTNREYPVGPNEWITLGKRKPGRYTLTIYNKKGEFVDNLTKNIDNKNKFLLNENTVSNSGRITGLSTGQKVAITAGAIGAAAVGGALINKLLNKDESQTQKQVAENVVAVPPAQESQAETITAPGQPTETQAEVINAFAPGGKPIKFLNSGYDKVTLIVEGSDGNPIGNNWVIPKATAFQKPQPLIYNGEKVTINPDQKVKAVLPNGSEVQRNGFELDNDVLDGSYVWVIK